MSACYAPVPNKDPNALLLHTYFPPDLCLAGVRGARGSFNAPEGAVERQLWRWRGFESRRDRLEGYEFETYDAEWLFREGLRRMRAEDCALAVQLYDRFC